MNYSASTLIPVPLYLSFLVDTKKERAWNWVNWLTVSWKPWNARWKLGNISFSSNPLIENRTDLSRLSVVGVDSCFEARDFVWWDRWRNHLAVETSLENSNGFGLFCCFLLCSSRTYPSPSQKGLEFPRGRVGFCNTKQIGHFRVFLCLCCKTSLSAKPLIWKWVLHAVSFSCKSRSFS